MTSEQILNYAASADFKPGKIRELARQMGIEKSGYQRFRHQIKSLERKGRLIRLRHNRYTLAEQIGMVVGILKYHPQGFALVANPQGETDVFISQANIGIAEDGDLVRIEIQEESGPKRLPTGRVVKVLEQADRVLIGTFFRRGNKAVVRPDTGNDRHDIQVINSGIKTLNLGDKVLLRLLRGIGREGEILEVLGDPNESRLDYIQIYKTYDLPFGFTAAVEAEVEALDLGLDEALLQRRDLRELKTFTIDPLSARDFDDAISIERTLNGGYSLGVHIADVSHYVVAGSEVDAEALKRSTSVYLLDRVVTMLPEKLATDICSLKPQEDRLAFSVLLEFDKYGNRLGYEIITSVIHSQARLTYEDAQVIFNQQEGGAGQALAKELNIVKELAEKLHKKRYSRGALDFDLAEPQVDVDAKGEVIGLGISARYTSNRLIEACMLAANEAVGDFSRIHELPVLYRVHLPPDQEKIRHFREYMATLGVHLKQNRPLDPKDLQEILRDIEDRPDADHINKLLLRAMMRAEYNPEMLGHFGLACEHYLHFTSPIRRYPDLWVHRVIKAYLAGDLDQLKMHQNGGRELGRLSSVAERQATEAERAYIRIKQLRFMAGHLGEFYNGKISGMVGSGFFVELENIMVDGFCPLATIDEYFRFYADRLRLIGERSGRILEFGTKVRVRIAAVDPDHQKMDLFFVGCNESSDINKPKKRTKSPNISKTKKSKRLKKKSRKRR